MILHTAYSWVVPSPCGVRLQTFASQYPLLPPNPLCSIQVNKQTTLSDKEKKKEIKRLQKMITDGRKKKTLNEDTILDLELKLEELKAAP